MLPQLTRLNMLLIIYEFLIGTLSYSHPSEFNIKSAKNYDCGSSVFGPSSCSDLKRKLAGSRIIGGRFAHEFEIPWQALVNITKSASEVFFCGGTLISAMYVLTAAHCIQFKGIVLEANQVMVVLGLLLRSHPSNWTLTSKVGAILAHPFFDEADLINDIALIMMKASVEFTAAIAPACLPLNTLEHYEHIFAIASGWGLTNMLRPNSTSDILKRARMVIEFSSEQRCKAGAGGALLPTELCAYGQVHDACGGDSGGPLVALIGGKCTLVGIISYGYKCGAPGYAGIFTRVSKYLDWIRNNSDVYFCDHRIK